MTGSRFIPTCVGNIVIMSERAFRLTVHPHVCGEHMAISAGVSNTSVHPHVCGEHSNVTASRFITPGSSPRVWGTYYNCRSVIVPLRFIPTCVGNMALPPTLTTSLPVHPHVCGEHQHTNFPIRLCNGSSPRVWGTCCKKRPSRRQCRFIPTCVGNILPLISSRPRRPVHPHVCGEH